MAIIFLINMAFKIDHSIYINQAPRPHISEKYKVFKPYKEIKKIRVPAMSWEGHNGRSKTLHFSNFSRLTSSNRADWKKFRKRVNLQKALREVYRSGRASLLLPSVKWGADLFILFFPVFEQFHTLYWRTHKYKTSNVGHKSSALGLKN